MKQPTLAEQRDWFEERANDPLESHQDRQMWQKLADELTARLNDRADDTQEGLF